MAWFKKVRKPIEAANKESRVPEGLWVKCPSFSQIIYNKDLASSLSVCTKCGHHFRISSAERLRSLFDDDWEEFDSGLTSVDPAIEVCFAQRAIRCSSRTPSRTANDSRPASRLRG